MSSNSNNNDDDSHTTLEGRKDEVVELDDDDDEEEENNQFGHAFAQTQDDVIGHGNPDDAPIPPLTRGDVSTTTASQEVRRIFSILDGSNSQLTPSQQAASNQSQQADSEVALVAPSQLKRYPCSKDLLTKHVDASHQLLKAVDDVGATKCTQASDKADPKGNAWSASLDVCHGGGAKGRGSMARFGFPCPAKATAFKKKVMDIWDWGVKHKDEIQPQLCDCCERQQEEHFSAKAAEKESSGKQKQLAEKQQQEMLACQQSLGARPAGAGRVTTLPPAHRGVEGMGRGQHSTDATMGEPAAFAFAHIRATQNQNLSPLSNTAGSGGGSANNSNSGSNSNSNTDSNNTRTPRTPGRHSPPRGATTLHNNTLDGVSTVCNNLNNIVGLAVRNSNNPATVSAMNAGGTGGEREMKMSDYERLAKRLKEDALFYKDLGRNTQCEETMAEHEQTSIKLRQLHKSNIDGSDDN